MSRKRTLVVDVDDTISKTYKRDYANAVPYKEMIDKLNKLHYEGWEIIYFTARGQLSTNYNIEEIERTRRPVLEKWLEENDVKYSQLLMGKPFGDYYIDDKAMTPEQFLDSSFGEKLEGRSGAEVSRVGDLVIKVAENTQMQVDWYNYATGVIENCHGFEVPEVLDSAPSVYRMAYLPTTGKFGPETIQAFIGTVESFINTPPMGEYKGSYEKYVNRSIRMLEQPLKDRVYKIAMEWEDYCDQRQSFCHGDLTLDNIIHSDKPYMIDPSIQPGIWSSWLIDIGRMMQSLDNRYEEVFKGHPVDDTKSLYVPYIIKHFNLPEKVVLVMQILIYCRILHHQFAYDRDDGLATQDELFKMLEKYGEI